MLLPSNTNRQSSDPPLTGHHVDSAQVVCGVDEIGLEDFRRWVDLGGPPFLARIFTEAELAFSDRRSERLAVRAAAKEAAAKMLGTGIRGIDWTDIEVCQSTDGSPRIALNGRAADRAREMGLTSVAVSLSHTRTRAIAFVVGLCEPPHFIRARN